VRRLDSIDLVRGAVMVLMAVDHAREYSAGPGTLTDPMDLATTPPLLFLMRWATHFCAPVFAFLMGVSAWLAADRRTPGDASRHFAIRGLVLLVLEFTLIDWAWTFNPLWPRKFFQVIAALGAAQLTLAIACRFSPRAVLLAGLAIVAGHNLLDPIRFDPGTALHYVWSFLHERNVLPLPGGFEVRTTYPFLPIVGLALTGFGTARPLFQHREGRARLVWTAGVLGAMFLLLRLTNLYGDPHPFEPQASLLYTLFSIVNVTKYPVGLQFALMTLAPALWFLGSDPRATRPIGRVLLTIGRAPLPFYVAHLYLLHLAAWAAALLMGFPLREFDVTERFGGVPAGFKFPLWFSPVFGIVTAVTLIPLCRWYADARASRRYPWLAYL
jgi:uncharacterized membrane protein